MRKIEQNRKTYHAGKTDNDELDSKIPEGREKHR